MPEPFRCDLCGQPLHNICLVRLAFLPGHTRMIWQGQCTRHDVSPHLARFIARVERLEVQNEDGDGWHEAQELDVLGDFDFEEEMRRC